MLRPSPRIALAVSWAVFFAVTLLALRRVLAVLNGQGDVDGLLVATLADALGLDLLGGWLRRYEGSSGSGGPVTLLPPMWDGRGRDSAACCGAGRGRWRPRRTTTSCGHC